MNIKIIFLGIALSTSLSYGEISSADKVRLKSCSALKENFGCLKESFKSKIEVFIQGIDEVKAEMVPEIVKTHKELVHLVKHDFFTNAAVVYYWETVDQKMSPATILAAKFQLAAEFSRFGKGIEQHNQIRSAKNEEFNFKISVEPMIMEDNNGRLLFGFVTSSNLFTDFGSLKPPKLLVSNDQDPNNTVADFDLDYSKGEAFQIFDFVTRNEVSEYEGKLFGREVTIKSYTLNPSIHFDIYTDQLTKKLHHLKY